MVEALELVFQSQLDGNKRIVEVRGSAGGGGIKILPNSLNNAASADKPTTYVCACVTLPAVALVKNENQSNRAPKNNNSTQRGFGWNTSLPRARIG